MKQLRITAAIILGLSLTACDEEQGRAPAAGPGAGGKADDAAGAELDPQIQRDHLAAVGACEATARRGREHTSVLRYVEQTEIEEERALCIAVANDNVRSALAATLQVTAPELADDVDDAFDEWRTEHTILCETLSDAHDDALEKSISAVQAGCIAESELRLAEAVEAFADLGGSRAAAPDVETRYASCYELYEAALEEGSPDMSSEIPAAAEDAQLQVEADAQELLADCIEEELVELIPQLSDRVVDAYPGRQDAQVEATLERTFENGSEGIGQVCIVLGYAAPGGNSVAVHECRAAAATWRHELLGYMVPELAPEEPETPTAPEDGGRGE